MRFTWFVRASVAAVLAIAVSSCAESNGPNAGEGSYDLVTYGGQPLPVVLRLIVATSTQPGGATVSCEDRLTASRLDLLGSNRFAQTDSGLLVCEDGRPDAPSQRILQGTYSAGADTITLDNDGDAATHYVQTARRSDGMLTIYRRQSLLAGGASTTDLTELAYREK